MSTKFELADRLKQLPPYIFSEINIIKAEATKKGISLLSLGIGDPDLPTPTVIVDKMKEAITKPENHLYSPYEGTLEFRKAVASWFKERFSVVLDPEKEVLALIGSKEGIAHFPRAFCNPGDKALYPSPGYPVFQTSLILAGLQAIPLPLSAETDFAPDLNKLEELFTLHRPRYMLINFPSNPTSATCTKDLLEEIVFLAKKYNVIIAYDNAYSEIYMDDARKPPSILEVPGAKDIAVEFHSFSKTFNMTGWRIAFAVGNAELLAGLGKIKTNIDSGPLLSVQETAAFALSRHKEITPAIRKVYVERCAVLSKGLARLGIEHKVPEATFFFWARVPGKMKSMDLCKALIEKQGLVVTPGIGFGQEGENFFRLALTVPNPQIEEAVNRLEKFLKV